MGYQRAANTCSNVIQRCHLTEAQANKELLRILKVLTTKFDR